MPGRAPQVGLIERVRLRDDRRTEVAHEIVDALNYLLAIANRLDIDVEAAFREKNALNQTRTWRSDG